MFVRQIGRPVRPVAGCDGRLPWDVPDPAHPELHDVGRLPRLDGQLLVDDADVLEPVLEEEGRVPVVPVDVQSTRRGRRSCSSLHVRPASGSNQARWRRWTRSPPMSRIWSRGRARRARRPAPVERLVLLLRDVRRVRLVLDRDPADVRQLPRRRPGSRARSRSRHGRAREKLAIAAGLVRDVDRRRRSVARARPTSRRTTPTGGRSAPEVVVEEDPDELRLEVDHLRLEVRQGALRRLRCDGRIDVLVELRAVAAEARHETFERRARAQSPRSSARGSCSSRRSRTDRRR